MKKLFSLILGLIITFSIASAISPKALASTQNGKPNTQKIHKNPWWHINWNIKFHLTKASELKMSSF